MTERAELIRQLRSNAVRLRELDRSASADLEERASAALAEQPAVSAEEIRAAESVMELSAIDSVFYKTARAVLRMAGRK